jgi:hypothetical protein
MGRQRKSDKHLPRRVYLHHGAYYFAPKGGKKLRLDADLCRKPRKVLRTSGGRIRRKTRND